MAGTVDLYPTDAAILVAHDVAYRPRPVFQSYVACSATLAAMNADYLRSPRAPDNILFDIQPLSWWSVWHDRGRFPTLDDGLSWPELLTRYDIAAASPQGGKCSYLWLKRCREPRQYALVPLQQRTIAFEETLPFLPSEQDRSGLESTFPGPCRAIWRRWLSRTPSFAWR